MLFWDKYPDAALIAPFKELRSRKGDDISSDLMWYIHYMIDPENDMLRHLPPDERKSEIKKSLSIRESDLKLKLVKASAEWYNTYWLSPPARLLYPLQEKLYEAEAVIKKFRIETPEDVKKYADMAEDFAKLKKNYDEYESQFKTTAKAPGKHGGGKVSMADDGFLFN